MATPGGLREVLRVNGLRGKVTTLRVYARQWVTMRVPTSQRWSDHVTGAEAKVVALRRAARGLRYPDTSVKLVPDETRWLRLQMSYIQREIDKINQALREGPDASLYEKLYAAQQALAWVLEPRGISAPFAAITGIPAGSEDCSSPRYPVPS